MLLHVETESASSAAEIFGALREMQKLVEHLFVRY